MENERTNYGSKKMDENKPLTPREVEKRRIFGQNSQLASVFFRHFEGERAWHVYTVEMRQTYMDYFRKKNYPVSDGPRGISYFPDFYFSVGWLVPAREARAAREGWTITLEWEVAVREYSLSDSTDRLLVGYFYDSRPDAPLLLNTLTATRGDRNATFTIPCLKFEPDEVLHLYPFFKRTDATAYSESRHLKC